MIIERIINQKVELSAILAEIIAIGLVVWLIIFNFPSIILFLASLLFFPIIIIDLFNRISFFIPISIEIAENTLQLIEYRKKRKEVFALQDGSIKIKADYIITNGNKRICAIHLSNNEDIIEISKYNGWQLKEIETIWENLKPYIERDYLMNETP